MVVRNDECTIEQIEELNFDSIIISPGPRTPQQAGITSALIRAFYNRKPILGICLGHQAIGEFFGAQLVKAQKPMHGKTSVVTHNGHFLFKGLPQQFEVMRYHSLVLNNVTETSLQVLAETTEGEVMGVAHPELPIVGVQFHPESILTPNGLQLLRNWFQGINN